MLTPTSGTNRPAIPQGSGEQHPARDRGWFGNRSGQSATPQIHQSMPTAEPNQTVAGARQSLLPPGMPTAIPASGHPGGLVLTAAAGSYRLSPRNEPWHPRWRAAAQQAHPLLARPGGPSISRSCLGAGELPPGCRQPPPAAGRVLRYRTGLRVLWPAGPGSRATRQRTLVAASGTQAPGEPMQAAARGETGPQEGEKTQRWRAEAHQGDVPTSRTDTQNVFLCRRSATWGLARAPLLGPTAAGPPFRQHTVVRRQSRDRSTSAGLVPPGGRPEVLPLTPHTQWVNRAEPHVPPPAAAGRRQSLIQHGAQPTGARRERFPRRLWQSRSFRP
jgi:hypothetical protein